MKEPIRAAGDLDHWFDKNVLIKQHCLSQAYCLNWGKQLQRSCVSSAVSEIRSSVILKKLFTHEHLTSLCLGTKAVKIEEGPA